MPWLQTGATLDKGRVMKGLVVLLDIASIRIYQNTPPPPESYHFDPLISFLLRDLRLDQIGYRLDPRS